jgi:hypothetical protein
MRFSSSAAPTILLGLLTLSSTTSAGFLDRFTGSNKDATQINLAADPAPPAEPSLDAFGGSAPGVGIQQPVPVVQVGAPSVAYGQPAVKTGEAVPVINLQDESNTPPPYEGTEYRWKMFKVRIITFWQFDPPLTFHVLLPAIFQFRPADFYTEAILL